MYSLFHILANAAGDSFALAKVTLGLAIDGTINGIAAFAFRDSNGDATMPQLRPDGSISVALDAGTTLRDSQILASGAQTKDVEAEVLVIDLVVTKNYTKPNAKVQSFRAGVFRMVYIDDYGVTDVEQELGYSLVDAGAISDDIQLQSDEFSTVGGTGVQKLVIYHTPTDKVANAYASASVNEEP